MVERERPPHVVEEESLACPQSSSMVSISDRLSRLRRGITLRATLAYPRNKPANRHLGLGMLGGRTHVPPRAETEWTVQVGQYAKTEKTTKERVGKARSLGTPKPIPQQEEVDS